ncbi:MAG: hypothetical protein H7318_14955 [Oligoflexus sp.]|nr:hypothetical protein [Oligoflexus sp.]
MKTCRVAFGLSLAIILSISCTGNSSTSVLKNSIVTENKDLHLQVYNLKVGAGAPAKVAALMGPYGENKEYKAVQMLGCASTEAAYQILGVNADEDLSKILTDSEKEDLDIQYWDSFPAEESEWKEKFNFGTSAIDCSPTATNQATWYFDEGTSQYYFPNVQAENDSFYQVDGQCNYLQDVMLQSFVSANPESTSGIPDAALGKVQSLACGSSSLKIEKPVPGWKVNFLSKPFFNFEVVGTKTRWNNSILLLTYNSPNGETSYFPVLSVNNERFSPYLPSAVNPVDLTNINQVLSRVAPSLPPVTSIASIIMPSKDEKKFVKAFASSPFLEVCLEGAQAPCQSKAYWIDPAVDNDLVDAFGHPLPLYDMKAAQLKSSEKTFFDSHLVSVVSIGDNARSARFAAQSCDSYSLPALFGEAVQQGRVASSASVEELKKEGLPLTRSFTSSATAIKSVSCDYLSTQICRQAVKSENELRDALKGTGCADTTAVIEITVMQDISLVAPITLNVSKSVSNMNAVNDTQLKSLKSIHLIGHPIEEGELKRAPQLIKNYATPDYRSLIKFQGLQGVMVQGLEFVGKQASVDQTALTFLDVNEAEVMNIKIGSTTPLSAFSTGVQALGSKLILTNSKIKVINTGVLGESSRVIMRGTKDDNWLEVSRPSESKGIKLNHSLLVADGLHLAADYGVSLSGLSAFFARTLEIFGINQETSVGFRYDSSTSYGLILGRPLYEGLYTVAWYEFEQSYESDSLKSSSLADCQNLTLVTKYCKQP